MAERYTRLFALTENLYQTASPVMIVAGALLKDTQTGRVLAQLKLQSLSDKPIKAAKVDITPLDVVGNELGEAVEHQYLDLNIHRDEAFGAKSPVALPDATTRAFRAAVTSVVFADNSVWEASNAAWEPLPKPVTLAEAYPDAELRKQFKLEFGAKSQYAYAEFADLCRCPCGALNRQEETKCHTCACDLLALRDLDIDELEKRKDERLEQERNAEEISAIEDAKRAKKKKRYIAIATIAVLVIIILLVIFVPMIRYNQAATLASDGKYVEAYDAFVALGEYRDSKEKALSIFALNELESIKLANIGDYVFFGSYEQDNSVSNGKERIEWLVVDIQEGKALLLSKYALDCQPLFTGNSYSSWKNCSLREWLNNDFLNTAFTDGEQELISVINYDKVSMLEEYDAWPYFMSKKAMHTKNELMGKPTAYAIAHGVNIDSDTGYCAWRLKPEKRGGDTTFWEVHSDGSVGGGVNFISTSRDAIRPAIWVDLSD